MLCLEDFITLVISPEEYDIYIFNRKLVLCLVGLIRVLHIVTSMNRGGLETMIMNYYRHIDRKHVQFDFLVHRYQKGAYDDEIEKIGGKIYRISKLNPFSLKYRKAIDAFFKNNKYDIVHCHLDCMSSIPLKYAKKNGIAIRIAHAHSSSQDKNIKYVLKLYYKTQIKKYATDLFACSVDAGNWMFKGNNFTIIRNAIDSDLYKFNPDIRAAIRKEFNIPENAFTVGHVGRFSTVKNHKFIVEVFLKIHDSNKNSFLLLIGDGELKQEIKDKIKELNLDNNVIFAGIRKDVSNILQAMDVFLFPSLYEGLPLSLIEAQSSGLKCFISDRVSSESIITNNVKLISLSKSPKEWADRILKYKDGYDRLDCSYFVKCSGFDIIENSNLLESYYINEFDRRKL